MTVIEGWSFRINITFAKSIYQIFLIEPMAMNFISPFVSVYTFFFFRMKVAEIDKKKRTNQEHFAARKFKNKKKNKERPEHHQSYLFPIKSYFPSRYIILYS